MKTDVEVLDATRVRLSVEVPFDEIAPNLANAYRAIARQVRIPGFRPGKVPARVIDTRVGRGAVLEQAINEALPRLYGRAVSESGVQALGRPEIDITEIDDGTSVTFTADIDVRPEFDLPGRDGLEITVDAAEVTDDDVEEQVDDLRRRFASQSSVERPAQDGDLVTLDLVATRDGEPVAGADISGTSYEVGSGRLVDGLDDAVRGLSDGESATFQATLPGEEDAGPADLTVTMVGVNALTVPDLDDEFAQLASEFDTADELRADLGRRLARAKRAEQLVAARDRGLAAYLERVDIAVPARLLEHEIEHRNTAMDQELETYGLSRAQYLQAQGTTVEEFDAETRTRASDSIRAQFVLDALAESQQLSVDENELTAHLINKAQRSGMTPDQYVQSVMQSGNVQNLVGEIVRGKALALLVREARVVDTNGAEVDIAALETELAPPPVSGSQSAGNSGEVFEIDADADESVSIDLPFEPDPDDR